MVKGIFAKLPVAVVQSHVAAAIGPVRSLLASEWYKLVAEGLSTLDVLLTVLSSSLGAVAGNNNNNNNSNKTNSIVEEVYTSIAPLLERNELDAEVKV